MMSTKRLHYFNAPGIVEGIRYILHYSGEKFEDVLHDRSNWPKEKHNGLAPFGVLPVFEDGAVKIHQSFAIARYLAKVYNLLTGDDFKDAHLDSIVLAIYDFYGKLVTYYNEKDPKKKAELKKEFEDEIIEYFFMKFEHELEKNGGHFAGKLTWADFMYVGFIVSANKYLGMELHTKFPYTSVLYNKIRSIPAIKHYIETRKPFMTIASK